MYVLYGGDFTRASLVQWVLDEGDIAHEFRRVDILKGEHRSADFLCLNPSGLVPVLVTPEGEVLHEVAALMLYLAARHGLADLAPPADDPDRGAFLSAVFDIAGEIQPEMKRFHFPHRYSLRREDDAGIRDQARSLLLGRLDVVNTRLARRGPCLLGPRFSLADVYLCFWIAYLGREDVCDRCPQIARLYDLVRSRPKAGALLDQTERMALSYEAMMERTPGGVIA
jgi:glutathione S-transferase